MKKLFVAVMVFVVAAAIAFGQTSSESTAADQGLLVARVLPDSPAAHAGIVRGDILLKLDGTAVNSIREAFHILSSHNAGDTITATITHGSETKTVSIQLETRLYHPALGIAFVPQDFGERSRMGMPAFGPGAYVDQVVANSPAANAGLKVGDMITSVGGAPLGGKSDLASLIRSHKPGDVVALSVERPDGSTTTLNATLGDKNGTAYLGIRYEESWPGMLRAHRRFFTQPEDSFKPFSVPFRPGAPGLGYPTLPDNSPMIWDRGWVAPAFRNAASVL
jgi:S1-C subfamily serine protease